jgi:hypothetical protein
MARGTGADRVAAPFVRGGFDGRECDRAIGGRDRAARAGCVVVAAGAVARRRSRPAGRIAATPLAPSSALANQPVAGMPERTTAVTASVESPAAATAFPVRGRVLDGEGAAAPSVWLTAVGGERPEDARADQIRTAFVRSEADGAFAGELPWPTAFLLAATEDLETVLISSWSTTAAVAPVVVVAPKIAVAGFVVAADGQPVESGEVEFEVPTDLRTRIAERLDLARGSVRKVPIAAGGRFAFPQLPLLRGAELRVTVAGRAVSRVACPLGDTDRLRIALPPAAAMPASSLAGVVLLANGQPADGARVAMGVHATRSDAAGRFRLPRPAELAPIVAALPGHGSAQLAADEVAAVSRSLAPSDLVLQLGALPGAVTGRVLSARGAAMAGAEVWLGNPTPFGVEGKQAVHLEYFLAGAPSRGMVLDGGEGDDAASAGMVGASCVHEPLPTVTWQFVVTDADGRFRLEGLLPRDYEVAAFDLSTGCFAAELGVKAGDDIELRLRTDLVHRELRARLVTTAGEPVADARVQQKIVPFRCTAKHAGGSFDWLFLRDGASVRTDARGGFVLRNVGQMGSYLLAEGDRIMPTTIDMAGLAKGDEVAVVVLSRCPVEVVLADAAEADAVGGEDGEGEPATMLVAQRDTTAFRSQVALHQGRSGVFTVSERVVALLLTRGGRVVRRVPIQPRVDRVVLVN